MNADILNIRFAPGKGVGRAIADDTTITASEDPNPDSNCGPNETDTLAAQADGGRQTDAYNSFGNPQQQDLLNDDLRAGSTPDKEILFEEIGFLVLENYHKLSLRQREFLREEGVFNVPNLPIMGSLLRQYLIHVSPYLPLIGENDFWSPDTSESGEDIRIPSDRVSLFVFNSMMVACSPVSFVPKHVSYRKPNGGN